MYLSPSERKEIMAAYGFEEVAEEAHRQVEPDMWVYFFKDDDKKYLLISSDYLGYFDFEVYPHLLKLENDDFNRLGVVLQREIPIKDESRSEKAAGTILFEYTS